MAYLGRQPIVGNYQVLDALTATATDTYALTKGGVAVFPQTPANCIVSLNGVIQAPFSSYNISGSNIVFASALTASDSIDFITVLGDVLNVGTVSDNTITTAKLANTSVTPAKMDLSQNYTFTGAVSGHNYPAFHASRTSNQTISNGTNTTIIFDTEIFDTDSAYNTATGTFTVPTGKDGKYVLYAAYRWQSGATFAYNLKLFKNTVEFTNANGGNNSSYNSNLLFVVADLSAGDNLVATAFQDSGGNVDLTGSGITTYFGAYRIGA
jgi:hypothetical protein